MTSAYGHGADVGYDVLSAGPRWRVRVSPERRVEVWARVGDLVTVVGRMSGTPDQWFSAALAEGCVLVMVGGPIPFVAGESGLDEILGWLCTHYTASGVVRAEAADR
ncbi:hypothetical protein [Acrocarpospora catenulata]|uniref:hypothetical protein n=1 Tax=Acrocarpospora catenulata TaxID=2836182 RepID=UPI001BDA87F7|nr:hypothetical protein [Acrocarpospora catenulata]